jgi:hypothetical protein
MKIAHGIMFTYFQLLRFYTHLSFDSNKRFNVGEMYMVYDKECYMWKPVIIIDNTNDLYEVEFVIGNKRLKDLTSSQIGIPMFG